MVFIVVLFGKVRKFKKRVYKSTVKYCDGCFYCDARFVWDVVQYISYWFY